MLRSSRVLGGRLSSLNTPFFRLIAVKPEISSPIPRPEALAFLKYLICRCSNPAKAA
ncbi:MAG TPA: hypothetical protein PKY82_14115 [Pyrinomonadaceae bacterium]|nr:hypothetical protein [Pyrinomonadaceae bacterium]